MTCQTCQFYWSDVSRCRRRSPSAEGWPTVQPEDTCGEWEAAVAIPEAMQQLGETIGKMSEVAKRLADPAPEPATFPKLKAGQVWRRRDGEVVTVSEFDLIEIISEPSVAEPEPAREPVPKPATDPAPAAAPAAGWIVDRLPTEEDGSDEGDVIVQARPGLAGGYTYANWRGVYPGTPWAPTDAIPDEPWDPTTLDRNGWIRSRLPTVEDAGFQGGVHVPMSCTGMDYRLIVPGQPWAPWHSNPGGYQP